MFPRIVNVPKSKSFFLFGARGTGKSTLLKESVPGHGSYRLDLLLPTVEERLARNPQSLIQELRALPKEITTVILDEVQKVPKLLDVVHFYLENEPRTFQFILTGSSGRKLKKGSANLLGGRAFLRELYPLIVDEVGIAFQIDSALHWGMLPSLFSMPAPEDKRDYLQTYIRAYIQEEIQREQVVRNLDPFRRFLEVAAQFNGQIINYTNMARGIGVDPKTVASYYEILEETLLGHFVLPFNFSFRKRLVKSPKFYFFDTGVARAAGRMISSDIAAESSYYGDLFEQFMATQIIHKAKYLDIDVRVCFYRDENDIEVDFVIDRPGRPLLFVEVKSTKTVTVDMVKNLKTVQKDFPNAEFELWSQEQVIRDFDSIRSQYWLDGLNKML